MLSFFLFFFFNDTATTEIYTLSLHDALPICSINGSWRAGFYLKFVDTHQKPIGGGFGTKGKKKPRVLSERSEEHTSELQSRPHLVCRLLLENKKSIIE